MKRARPPPIRRADRKKAPGRAGARKKVNDMKLKDLMQAMQTTQRFILLDVTTEKTMECNVWQYFERILPTSNDERTNLDEAEILSIAAENNIIKLAVRTGEEFFKEERAEDRADFVQELGNLMNLYAGRTNVKSMEYIQDGYDEFVLITFENGEQKKKCITGDSSLAIINDIYKTLR